jgi:hypothetical protein
MGSRAPEPVGGRPPTPELLTTTAARRDARPPRGCQRNSEMHIV